MDGDVRFEDVNILHRIPIISRLHRHRDCYEDRGTFNQFLESVSEPESESGTPLPRPGLRRDHRAPILIITKAVAAQRQLETAISLWFNSGDPVSIHTLAAAALDCLHAIGTQRGNPSAVATWIETQPTRKKERIKDAQNFFKHGFRDVNKQINYDPTHGETLLSDAAVTYGLIFGRCSPLMDAFQIRFAVSNSRDFLQIFSDNGIDQSEVESLANLSRREFLEKMLPRLT